MECQLTADTVAEYLIDCQEISASGGGGGGDHARLLRCTVKPHLVNARIWSSHLRERASNLTRHYERSAAGKNIAL